MSQCCVAALGKGLPFPADCALPTMLVARLSVTELSTWPTSGRLAVKRPGRLPAQRALADRSGSTLADLSFARYSLPIFSPPSHSDPLNGSRIRPPACAFRVFTGGRRCTDQTPGKTGGRAGHAGGRADRSVEHVRPGAILQGRDCRRREADRRCRRLVAQPGG